VVFGLFVCFGYVRCFISLCNKYKDVRYTSQTCPLTKGRKGKKKMELNYQKEIQTKLTKGLLDVIILEFLNQEPMHGYQVISKIRKTFGVYFGPSTVYPMLSTLEQKSYIESHWNMETERPRKVYTLTADGQSLLKFAENSLNLIRKNLSPEKETSESVVIFASNQKNPKKLGGTLNKKL
jgi:PadR family transcriptional regulator PadR